MDKTALESVWTNLLNHAPYSFVCLDPNLQVVWRTAQWSDLSPMEPGSAFVDGLDPFTAPRVVSMFEHLADANEPDSREITMHHRLETKRSFPMDYTWVTCRDGEGKVTGYLGMGRTPGESQSQVKDLQEQLHRLLGERDRNSRELTRLRGKVEKQGHLDGLTGMGNRSFIMERLEHEVPRAVRYDHPLTVLLIDIDHLGRVNEEYSTGTGDDVIRQVAGVIQDQIRNSDLAARFDGEQFMVLCTNTDRPSAQFLAERLRRRVAELSFHYDGEDFGVTVSTGMVTVQSGNNVEVEALLRAVETALEAAKHGGMNRVQLMEAP